MFFLQVLLDSFLQGVIQPSCCRPLNISPENLPATTWCKVRHFQPGTPTSYSWSVDWERDQFVLHSGHFRTLILFFSLVYTELEGTAHKWKQEIFVTQASCFPFSPVLNQNAFFFFRRPILSTLQWMENILVLLPKHRQEHRLCRRTAACALLQVFSYRAIFSWSFTRTPPPTHKPL